MDAQSSGQIFKLIPKIMGEIGAIAKSRRNPQQGYAFRGIDDLYNAVQSHFADNGVFVVPEVLDQVREERKTAKGNALIYTVLRVKHTFYASDGSHFSAITVGEAMDSGDKSANKSMSAAMKYALIEVFAIPTEGDNDTESQSHEVRGRAQQSPQRRESVDRGTGEVSEPPKLLSNEEAAQAGADLDNAFQQAGFDPESADKILLELLKRQKHPNIKAAGREFVDRVIENIKSGKYDKLKNSAGKELAHA